MKIKFICKIVLSVFLILGSVQELFSLTTPTDTLSVGTEEEYTYIVSYKFGIMNFDVAIAKITVTEEKYKGIDALKVVARANTAPAYENFFYMDDTYTVWMDKETLKPMHLINHNKENDYRFYSEYWYDWDKMTVKTKYSSSLSPECKHEEYSIDDSTLDPVSMFMNLRKIPFSSFLNADGESLNLAFYDKIRSVKYYYDGAHRDRVKGHGKQNVHKFRCDVLISDKKDFDDGTMFEMWFRDSDRINKIPVILISPVRVGSIAARLATPEQLERFYK